MLTGDRLGSVFLEIESELREKGLRSMIFLRDTLNEKYPDYEFGAFYDGDDLVFLETKSGRNVRLKGGKLNAKNT